MTILGIRPTRFCGKLSRHGALSLPELLRTDRVQGHDGRGGLHVVWAPQDHGEHPGASAAEPGTPRAAVVNSQTLPALLFTRQAVSSFSKLFQPAMGTREAKRALVRLGTRTHTVLDTKSRRALMALAPDGADVVFLARRVAGIDSLVVTRVVAASDADEEDDEFACPCYHEGVTKKGSAH